MKIHHYIALFAVMLIALTIWGMVIAPKSVPGEPVQAQTAKQPATTPICLPGWNGAETIQAAGLHTAVVVFYPATDGHRRMIWFTLDQYPAGGYLANCTR